MTRKRGGLAGVWDRNKKIIKPIATLAAGALTGGAGGALVGGLMNGLDREGKGGIGFDLKKGAMGAAQGYGMGKLGAGLKQGIMSRLGANAVNDQVFNAGTEAMNKGLSMVPDVAAPDLAASGMGNGISSSLLNAKTGITPLVGNTARVASSMPSIPSVSPSLASNAMAMGGNAGGMAPSMMQRGMQMAGSTPWWKDGKAIAAIGNTATGAMNAYQNNRAMQMQRAQQERENQLIDEDRDRREALDPVRAQLLAAMFKRMGLNTGAV